jgi:hypothetical protein
MWYATYLVYDLGHQNGPVGRLKRLQEDLVLLAAKDANEVYVRALQLGSEVGSFGQRWLSGEPDALHELGIELERPSAALPDQPEGQVSPLLHPPNAEIYRGFRFLGLKDIVHVPGDLKHGTQIDLRRKSATHHVAQDVVTPPEDLQAFSPAGPAYAGRALEEEKLKLYERNHWYTAEQIFSTSRCALIDEGLLERVVLLYAPQPERAASSAADNGLSWARRNGGEFCGLHELSLVDGQLEDGCELRSAIFEIAMEDIPFYVTEKEALSIFSKVESDSGRT